MNNEVPTIPDDRDLEDTLRGMLQESENALELITPADAVQMYLDDRKRDCQQATVKGHRSRLNFFVDWCTEQGIDNMNDISARDLHEFQVWRREDLNVVSERTQMSTLRVFIKWCETIDAVPEGLFNKINVPNVPQGEGSREKTLHADRVEEIVEYLGTYEYATVEHVTWLILA